MSFLAHLLIGLCCFSLSHGQEASAVAPVAGPTAEELRKILQRIEHLEAREAQRASAEAAANSKSVEELLVRIRQLESKISSFESSRANLGTTSVSESGQTLRELDQKIRVMERKGELATEAAAAKAQEAPRISIGKSGFSFSSADTNYVIKLKGLVQVDSRTFFDDNPRSQGNDSFVLRRARPILEGTLFRDVDYLFVPDFAGSAPAIFDAYLQYRLAPEFQIRAGKFKSPVGLEQLLSDATLPFNERSLVSSLVPNRSVGLQLGGDVAGGRLSYALGVFNGSGDGRNAGATDFGDDKEFAGRVFLQPFKTSENPYIKGLGFGVGGSYSQVSSNAAGLSATTGGTLPGYATDGQQQYFAYNPTAGTVVADGNHWRISPQGYYLVGPFGLVGEYAISQQAVLNTAALKRADLAHSAWNITAQWVLTGEPASLSGIDPAHPFRLQGDGWGAWQFVARYGQLDLDRDAFVGYSNPKVSANGATAWSVGINWWLNRNLRLLTSFSHTTFSGGGSPPNLADTPTLVNPGLVTQQSENAIFTRLQLSF